MYLENLLQLIYKFRKLFQVLLRRPQQTCEHAGIVPFKNDVHLENETFLHHLSWQQSQGKHILKYKLKIRTECFVFHISL